MRDEPDTQIRHRTNNSFWYHERCWSVQTAGRWPWKLESAWECVTTHLFNGVALKKDGFWVVGWVCVCGWMHNVGGRGLEFEGLLWGLLDLRLLQILVVVAITCVWGLKWSKGWFVCASWVGSFVEKRSRLTFLRFLVGLVTILGWRLCGPGLCRVVSSAYVDAWSGTCQG